MRSGFFEAKCLASARFAATAVALSFAPGQP